MNRFWVISLDPAQLYDYSALSILECVQEKEGNIYHLRSVKRKQKLPYPEIVQWAEHVFKNPKFQQSEGVAPPKLVIDVGGVGRALYDMIRADGLECIAVQYTGGGEVVSFANGAYHVGKSFLVGKFLAAWDDGRVQVPANASFRDLLVNELKAFRGYMSSQGRARFESEQGEHDDVIMSVAQAVWWCETHRPQEIPKLSFGGATKKPTWAGTGSRGGNWFAEAAAHHGSGGGEFIGGINHR
ncbi:MAG TPA: hypothetical protein PLY52_12400 [Methanothrix sp.]|nr:hypothetical protein [Methanothrix sp.]